jgi:hypothetical protein
MRCFINMQEFIVHHILQSELLNGNEFMNLTNTCKEYRKFNTEKSLKRLWKHGKVKSIKTALYVEQLLKKHPAKEILEETITPLKESEVVSALRRLLSQEKMAALSTRYKSHAPSVFLLERIAPLKSILGKRSKHYI